MPVIRQGGALYGEHQPASHHQGDWIRDPPEGKGPARDAGVHDPTATHFAPKRCDRTRQTDQRRMQGSLGLQADESCRGHCPFADLPNIFAVSLEIPEPAAIAPHAVVLVHVARDEGQKQVGGIDLGKTR